MKLNSYLKINNTSKSAFADKVGTTVATISRIGDGLVVPRRELLERIHRETDGQVTPNDLVGLYCTSGCQVKEG